MCRKEVKGCKTMVEWEVEGREILVNKSKW